MSPVESTSLATAVQTMPMRLARGTFVVLLTLSIVLPTMLQSVKIALLAVVVGGALLARETWSAQSSPKQTLLDLWAVLFATAGLVWSIGGLVRGNPGSTAMLSVHAAYPLLAILLWRIARPGDFTKLSGYLVLAAALVLATQALFIASFFGIDDGAFFRLFLGALDEDTAVVDAGEDYLLFTLPSVSSLLFMAPWLAVYSVLTRKNRAMHVVLFFVAVGALMLAGRRASLLALATGLCVAFFAAQAMRRRDTASSGMGKRLVLLLFALGISVSLAFATGLLNSDLLVERVTSIFDFSGNESNIVRRLQFDALLDGIIDHPLLGNGLGAAASYTRSDEQPWAYELSYVALAFQFGLLGFFFFVAGGAFLLWKLAQLVRSKQLEESERLSAACFLAGLVALLVSNATNPYLAKFDYMWVLFIPLGMIRLYSFESRPTPLQSSHGHRQVPPTASGNARIETN